MRRWAQLRHGLDLPHYAVSIVRGRGIDANALRWLAAHHDPADVVFVDGWTGKGAITRELAERQRSRPTVAGFDPEIAVLADPGSLRADLRHPRRLPDPLRLPQLDRLRADLAHRAARRPGRPGRLPRREVLPRTRRRGRLGGLPGRRRRPLPRGRGRGRRRGQGAARQRPHARPGRAGAAVERISEEYGIHDVNLVKPGVGETTRVLLRRVPWKILARAGAGADLDHVRLLAEQRACPSKRSTNSVHLRGADPPPFTRGATGADGKAVTPLMPTQPPVLVASDLDRTLIYSAAALGADHAGRAGAPAAVRRGARGAGRCRT